MNEPTDTTSNSTVSNSTEATSDDHDRRNDREYYIQRSIDAGFRTREEAEQTWGAEEGREEEASGEEEVAGEEGASQEGQGQEGQGEEAPAEHHSPQGDPRDVGALPGGAPQEARREGEGTQGQWGTRVAEFARGEGSVEDVLAGRAGWCVIEGDCLEILPTIPRVDHVITDPPYEAEAHTKQRRIKASASRGATWKKTGGVVVVEPLTFEPVQPGEREAWGAEIGRLAKRWAIVFCQVEAAVKWSASMPSLNTRRIGVWVKPDGQAQLSGDRPGMGYESIVFAHARGRSSWNGGGRSSVFVANKNDLIDNGKNSHPTQKPLLLMLELVRLFTDPGELILDAFAGSGTTGVASMRYGRRVILIEKKHAYASLARERMLAEEQSTDLSAARARQTPMFSAENMSRTKKATK